MKKVDILIIYETKVRELESICLLKSELEHRGYTVGVLNTWNEYGQTKPKYDAKVVVSPSMYNDGIFDFVKSMSGNVPKLVNLQWEQIGPVGDDKREDAWYILKGLAKQCMHICWGPVTYNRLLSRANIDEAHLRMTGQIALDYCRPEFRSYYLKKEDLFKDYSIPLDKEINLFISSFSYVNLPKELEQESLFSEVDAFIKFSCESFYKVLDWFDRFMLDNPEQVLIYRPHPSEADNESLHKLCDKYKGRFFLINQLSVKQWIATADRVYTWFSTASAEAYAFGKPIAVLRPEPIPEDLETTLLQNVDKISTYEGFVDTLNSGCCQSLTQEDFEKYYLFDDTPAYVRVADAVETVYKDDKYKIIDTRPVSKTSVKQKVKNAARSAVTVLANWLPKESSLLKKYRNKKVVDDYTKHRQIAAYASPEEIRNIQNKIEEIFFDRSKNR